MKFSQFMKETTKEKAADTTDLINSIRNGVFTKDGTHLKVKDYFNCAGCYLISLVGGPKMSRLHIKLVITTLLALTECPRFVHG